ncbi:hypothetical protein HZB01_04245 [Candidatus Woesearchaeota archaeon]|nr:hypothetical protein [Candidatus Woesearchaeota archaeon]
MKTPIYLIILLLLFIPLAHAASIHDEWHASGSTATIDGTIYKFRYYPQNSKLSLGINDANVILEDGGCWEDIITSYCFKEAREADDGSWEIKFTIESAETNIQIERTASIENPTLNQPVTITTVFTNTGGYLVDVQYEETVPSPFRLMSGTGGKAVWAKRLPPDGKERFAYTITPVDYGSVTLTPKISYSLGGLTVPLKADEIKLTVKDPYTLEKNFTPANPKVNQNTEFKVKITNPQSAVMPFSATFTFPKELQVTKVPPNVNREQGSYKFSSQIKPSSSEEIIFSLKGSEEGEHFITITTEAEVSKKTVEKSWKESVWVGASKIIPKLELTPEEVQSNGNYNLILTLTNRDTKTIEDISLSIRSDIFKQDVEGITLKAGETKQILKKNLIAPNLLNLNESQEFMFTVEGNYEAAEPVSFSGKKSLSVIPQKRKVQITYTLDKEQYESGENMTITVAVKNLLPKTQAISAIAKLPKGIKKEGGTFDADFSLHALEQSTMTYTISTPANYSTGSVRIETLINAKNDDGTLYKDSVAYTLLLGTGPEQGNEENQDTTSTDDGQSSNETEVPDSSAPDAEVVEQPGFFGRLWTWISGLFG